MSRVFKEYYKYCIVGVLMTGLDFSMLAFQVEILKVYYLLAASVAYLLTAVVHYILSANYVFKDSKTPKNFKYFLYFAFLGAIGLCLLEGLMYYLVEKMDIYYLLAKALATGVIFSFNFAAKKYLIFK
ncbi:MAG: GtrA family protein [Candidatus Gastranaerophilales bacterium]|nr:GtrA family protein [Candidatus Gastranaerophilales bacterium]